ncbi:thioester-containing protein 1 allele S1-like [Anopheles bellator]|uniref:thioester-containing protein 1 allele S1-like n=1 Tax=Anopheles bellator TaxID=139047 RepID=UPI0026481E2A|nr:thioester-containing protein 1 allele S1-like [Anopheles bellator]
MELDIVTSDESQLAGQIQMNYQPKVSIQLSQSIYSPGDFMKFRVLLTNEQYKPVPGAERSFNATVYLEDDAGFKVLSWSVPITPGEIYSSGYLFSDHLNLGTWTLAVTIDDATTSKSFQVMHYSAPIHKIVIETDGISTIQDKRLVMNVSAMYSFGKPLKGMLTLTVTGDRSTIESSTNIVGEAQITLPLEKLIAVNDRSQAVREISVRATLLTTNHITNRTYQYARTIPIYTFPHKLTLQKMVGYEPGQNATILVQLTNAIGEPLHGTSLRKVSITVWSEDDQDVTFEQLLDDKGTAVVSIVTPELADHVTFDASYEGATSSLTVHMASAAFTKHLIASNQLHIDAVKRDRLKYNVKVHANHDLLVGIAIYDGVLDLKQISTYMDLSHNCTIDRQRDDVSVVSRYDLLKMPPLASNTSSAPDESANDLRSLLLWESRHTSNGSANFAVKVPTYVKSWTVTALAYSPTEGLLVAQPKTYHREDPLEIHLHVPYSVTRLEVVPVDVYVVNNDDRPVDLVFIELSNEANEFSFMNNSGRTDAIFKTVRGRLEPNSVQRAEFLIRPKKLGSIILKANAYASNGANFSSETILRAVPESVQRSGRIVRYFNLEKSDTVFKKLKIPIPRTAESGTERIIVSIQEEQNQVVSLSVPMLLDTLVEADPFTMATKAALMQDVLLEGQVQWTERWAKASEMIRRSVRKIEALASQDGSFAIPDIHRPQSTCWDTVIATQALMLAARKQHSAAREEVLIRSLNWLKSQQATDGSFCKDTGVPDSTGDEASIAELTAHTLLLLASMESLSWRYVSTIDRSRSYLIAISYNLVDPYQLALVGYALQFTKKQGRDEEKDSGQSLGFIINQLLAQKKRSPSQTKHWWRSNVSTDLIATSYALFVFTQKGLLLDAGPIVNWIKQQQYRAETPSITPNTHIALRALIAYAKRTIFLTPTFVGNVIAEGTNMEPLEIPFDHQSDKRSITLSPTTRSVSFTINGTVAGSFEVGYSYAENIVVHATKFDIKVVRLSTSSDDYTDWNVCLRFLPTGFTEKTNMVSCEISFPTGYIALDDSVAELQQMANIVTTTLKNEETVLLVIFELIGLDWECFNVTGFRQTIAPRQLPGTIKVYDITDTSKVAFQNFDTVS